MHSSSLPVERDGSVAWSNAFCFNSASHCRATSTPKRRSMSAKSMWVAWTDSGRSAGEDLLLQPR